MVSLIASQRCALLLSLRKGRDPLSIRTPRNVRWNEYQVAAGLNPAAHATIAPAAVCQFGKFFGTEVRHSKDLKLTVSSLPSSQ